MKKIIIKISALIIFIAIFAIILAVVIKNNNAHKNYSEMAEQSIEGFNNISNVAESQNQSNGNTILNDTVSNSINNKIKIDKNEDFLYDADYPTGTEIKSYTVNQDTSSNTVIECSLDDLVVPYINIKTDDATKANDEIKKIYDKILASYKSHAEESQNTLIDSNSRVSCTYSAYKNGNILSVLITTLVDGVNNNYTYNFSMTDGSLLKFEDLYKYVGYDSSNIGDKVKDSINANTPEYQQSVFTDKIFSVYQKGNFPYYINENNKLIITLDIGTDTPVLIDYEL